MLIGNPAKRINSEIKVLNENISTVVESIHLHPMFLLNRHKQTQRKFWNDSVFRDKNRVSFHILKFAVKFEFVIVP